MTESSLESVLKIFSFEKKGELEKYCRNIEISSERWIEMLRHLVSIGYFVAEGIS